MNEDKLVFKRPPREAYIRAAFSLYGFEVHPGVEWRLADDVEQMQQMLRVHAEAAVRTQGAVHEHVVRHLEALILRDWPDRAYFIETERAGAGVQVYQPFGMPRNQ